MRRALGLVIVSGLLASCAHAPAVRGTCDVPALQEQISHIVADSGLTVASVDEAVCQGDWSYARVTLTGDGDVESQDGFLFLLDRGELLMKAPESTCAEASLPPEVAAAACAGLPS